MTAVDVDALDKLREAATVGVWKLWGMDVMADQDGTSNVDTAVLVAHTAYRDENGKPRTFDADLICQMQQALPDLLAEVRRGRALREAVEGLAAEMETTADSRRVLALDAEAAGASEESLFLRDRADDERAQADRLRALLAAVDGGEQ